MRRSLTARALVFGSLAALMVPATASADVYDRAGSTGLLQSVGARNPFAGGIDALPFANQGQCQMRQRREITAGPHAALRGHERCDPAVQHFA